MLLQQLRTVRLGLPLIYRLKFGERCFAHAAAKARNTLLTTIQCLTDLSTFKRQLKIL